MEQEIRSALDELGERAATAYLTHVEKADSRSLHRLVGRIVRSLNLPEWIRARLEPILRNHAARTLADTRRTLQTEIGLELSIADERAQRVAERAGADLGLADIEPQVRQTILNTVRDAAARGQGAERTARQIREMVPAGRFTHAGARYRARLIARDQTLNFQREAALAAYESNPHITHVRLRDGIFGPPRSDSQCIARNGEIVPIGEAASIPPYHPNCTLGLEPVVSGPALHRLEPQAAA